MNKNKNSKRAIYVAVIAAAIGLAVWGWNGQKEAATSSLPPESFSIPFNKQGELAFLTAPGGDTTSVVDIEVAQNNASRARGLMYREALPEDAGMLFIFEAEEIQSFWMRNTYIPLDMIFVNARKEIVTIHANTAPLKEWNYASTAPALYVVEVNAGYCRKRNIKVGDRIEFIVVR